ncbi:MAG TPA: hypothetical protein VKN36_00675 [Eudoraea sp.]|nr:hypothetical protein [Eudoraea sp.]
MQKQILIRSVVMAIVYTIVILIISNDYSVDNLLKVAIQGVVFALVFGLVIWLLESWKGKKK